MILLFARSDHPLGYGFPQAVTDPDGHPLRLSNSTVVYGPQATAHGYVVIAVICSPGPEAEAVVARMAKGFKGKPRGTYGEGYLGDWYGGRFDCVAVIEGGEYDITGWPPEYDQKRRSIGDNRFFGVWHASEVLVEEPADTQSHDD